MRSLSTLNKYLLRYKVRLTLGILFVGISNFFGVYWTPIVREAVDFAVEAKKDASITYGVLTSELLYYGGMIIIVAITSGFFMFLMRQTIIVMSRLIEYDLKNDIYSHYQSLDQSFYKRNNTGDLMNRISEDVSRVRMYIGPAIMYLVNTTVTVVTVIIFMASVNVTYTIWVLLPLPILAFIAYKVSDIINRKSNDVQAQLSTLSTHAQESFSGIRILKSFSMEEKNAEELKKKADRYKTLSLSLAKTESLFQPAMVLLMGLCTILVIFVGGMQSIDGNITPGNIAEFVIYVNRLMWPVASLGWVTSLIQRAAASQERINEFLDTKPEIVSPPAGLTRVDGSLAFEHVGYTYPDSGIRALNDISFKIEKGKSLAIVGRTGSGKSTIAGLISRVSDPQSGIVKVDDKNLKEFDLGSLRSSIGYVPQEVFLFSDTIANNIAFTASNEKPSKERIEQAAMDAAIHENIMDFPEKYETMIGERGITLSGGQKQRVSIARAIIHSPNLLVLDDPLSAVDTETEDEILTNLLRVMKNKTTVIISHRVSSVKHCDHIIFLENGSIAEEGTHDELLLKKGLYEQLHTLQLLEKEEKRF